MAKSTLSLDLYLWPDEHEESSPRSKAENTLRAG